MMKQIRSTYLLVIFYGIISFCSAKTLSNLDLKSFDSRYEGIVGDKKIVLYLDRFDGALEGVYYRDSAGPKFYLKGTLNNAGHYIFSETNDSGKYIGTWETYCMGDSMNGVWDNPLNNEHSEFALKRISGNLDIKQKKFIELGCQRRSFSFILIGLLVFSIAFLIWFLFWLKSKRKS